MAIVSPPLTIPNDKTQYRWYLGITRTCSDCHDSEKSAEFLEPRLFVSTSIAYAAVATEEELIARAKERT